MVLPTGLSLLLAKLQRLEFPVAIGGAADMDGRADQPDTDVNDPMYGPTCRCSVDSALPPSALAVADGGWFGQYLRYVGFCWSVPCSALWRELMHCSKRRARIVLHHLVASPNARDFA